MIKISAPAWPRTTVSDQYHELLLLIVDDVCQSNSLLWNMDEHGVFVDDLAKILVSNIYIYMSMVIYLLIYLCLCIYFSIYVFTCLLIHLSLYLSNSFFSAFIYLCIHVFIKIYIYLCVQLNFDVSDSYCIHI